MNYIKQQILDEIRRHSTVFKKASPTEFRIRCPICGDSKRNPNDAHCYIKCTDDPNEPLLYHCFLCPGRKKGGIVDKKFLQSLGVDQKVCELMTNQRYNRIPSIKESNIGDIIGTPIMNSPQVRYVEQRLGPGFTEQDYSRFKILWNIEKVKPFVKEKKVLNTLPTDESSISFLSSDKMMILSRSFSDETRWRKIKIMGDGSGSFYTIQTTVNLFSNDQVIVNIAEGVFDILSAYKNFNDENNGIFIAALGQDYCAALEYMITTGFVGSNIIVRIYMDSDIEEKPLVSSLRRYKWLFDSIWIYKNILYKDIGVPINQIKLQERRI